jgi:CotS family spore coat protein
MPYTAKTYNVSLLSEDNVKKYVLPYYGLGNAEILQIKFKDTQKQRAVYKVDYNQESFCLKKIYFSREDLLFVYSGIEWLYRNGLNVPRILPTKDKSRFVDYEGMLFILTYWIEGSKCNYDNIQNVLDSITNLGKMHKTSKSFIPIEGSTLRVGYDNLYHSLNKHFEHILVCSNLAFKYGDKFSKTFLQNFDTNVKLAEISSQISSTINNDNLGKSLCHLDYVNKNIIFDVENKVWTIDFDKCKMDYSVHDISYFLRRLLKRDGTKWDIEIAVSSLKLYDEICPLNLDEYKSILVYLAFPQKYWKLSRDYYNNINKCNKNSFLLLIKKACENADYHLEFINEFKVYVEDKFNTKIES